MTEQDADNSDEWDPSAGNSTVDAGETRLRNNTFGNTSVFGSSNGKRKKKFHLIRKGQLYKVRAGDSDDPHWEMAKVLDVVYDQSTGHHSALFHYIGFNHKFDEWIDIRSKRIIKNDVDSSQRVLLVYPGARGIKYRHCGNYAEITRINRRTQECFKTLSSGWKIIQISKQPYTKELFEAVKNGVDPYQMTVRKPDRRVLHEGDNTREDSSDNEFSETSPEQDFAKVYLSSISGMKKYKDCYLAFWEGLATGSRGLDMGCGPEAIAAGIFFDKGFEMIASDVEDQEETIEDDIEFVHSAQAHTLHFRDENFDFLINKSICQQLKTFKKIQKMIQEIARVLRPGGKVLLIFKEGVQETTLNFFDGQLNQYTTIYIWDHLEITRVMKLYGLEPYMRHFFVDSKRLFNCIIMAQKLETFDQNAPEKLEYLPRPEGQVPKYIMIGTLK